MVQRTPKSKTQVRQEQIAQAALMLIARRGLNQLNLDALAGAVGVVPSAIYRHYPGKDGVLDSVLELISKQLLANVQAVREATKAPLERLRLLLLRHVRLVRHHAGIPRVLFSEQIFAGRPARRRRAHQILQEYLQEIARIITEGQQAGCLRADIPVETVALMFLGLVQPAVIRWLMSNGSFDVARHVEKAWGLFSTMLRQDGLRSAKPEQPVSKGARPRVRHRPSCQMHNLVTKRSHTRSNYE